MSSTDGGEVPTVAEPRSVVTGGEPPASWLGDLAGIDAENERVDTDAPDGLQSQVLLARARSKLLGWDDAPVQIGRYRIIAPIGTGGMGVVYEAHDDELDRAVAIKVLRRDLAPGSTGRQRLVREAQATAKLSHPNVVHVYEVGQAGEQVFMAMELVRGDTLRAWKKAVTRTWREVVDMYLAAGEGLVAAHAEGIVHRDFKPDNVLVNREGRPQIVDFGLARSAHDAVTTTRETAPASISGSRLRDFDITRTGTVVGTPAYMAPEQLARAEPDARSDQFSFCASLFEALYGKRPFAGSTYTELERSLTDGRIRKVERKGDVPRAIHAAVLRGLSASPDDRFPTMRALLDALAAGRNARIPTGWVLAVVASLGVGGVALAMNRASEPASPEPTPAVATTPEPADDDPWAPIVAATDLPPLVPTPLDGDPAGVTVHRLRNGLTIYVARRPHEPVVAAALVVRAGSVHETPEQDGLAMFATTSILKGTERLGVIDAEAERPLREAQHRLIAQLAGETDPAARKRIIDEIAASEKASSKHTIESELFTAVSSLGGRDPIVLGQLGPVVTAEIPRHRVGAWMQLHAEAAMRPVFREFLAGAAKQLGFINWYGTGGGGMDMLHQALGEATGLHHDRDKAIALLERVPLADARALHETLWRPNNAAIVLVGDISPAEAIALAEQSFGAWEPAPIPVPEVVDRRLPGGRVEIEIEDAGPPSLEIAWPMPPQNTAEHHALVTLARALGGRKGLLGALTREKTGGWGVHAGDHRDFNVFLMLAPGQSAKEGEQIAIDALTQIAEDRVPDDAWHDALAEAQFEQLAWARGPGTLMLQIADTFLAHRPWTTGPGSPAAPPPTRAEVVEAAKVLLARDRVVLHKRTGKPLRFETPSLPNLSRVPGAPAHGQFVRDLLATPTTPTEPRFLVEGSHFEQRERGAGRVITVKTDSPLFHLAWVYPVGTSEDPWACDALRGRMRLAPITGAQIDVFCTTTDTRYEIVAAADRFAEVMPPLVKWFGEGTLERAEAQELAGTFADMRVEIREQPFLHATAAEFFGLLGESALNVQLPNDAELRKHGGAEMIAGFERMRGYAVDVLYAGPDPDALHAMLPAQSGETKGGPYERRYRETEGPEILLIESPQPDVSVRASLPWLADSPRTQLAAAMHRELARDAEHAAPLPPDPDGLGYSVGFSPGPPIAIGIGFHVPPADVPKAIETALSALRARPNRTTFAAAHDRLETAFRVHRTAPAKITDLVYSWGRDATDPRVAQWLALPSLSYDDVMAYYEAIDRLTPVVVVAGDVSSIDTAALERFGKIVRVDPTVVIRDPMISGFGRDMPLLIDE
jgi:predicted Zn-dependent peptidase